MLSLSSLNLLAKHKQLSTVHLKSIWRAYSGQCMEIIYPLFMALYQTVNLSVNKIAGPREQWTS